MNIGFEICGNHTMGVSMDELYGFYWLLKQIEKLKGREDRFITLTKGR